ncbi:FKBP-type peptidyl-prolyl cis-trans isomerase [Natronococcus wangiae]|uniref:FKBP-type peptidyl-prolyl cis-trans isomerase n=1 Tax=Natronococcus wangiae TaxID=3068275 RepID=UPI00273DFCDB|nr:FKBP-type peptidyl-prolyl cis-trans isomerase [Natronococcus sp. AD5]
MVEPGRIAICHYTGRIVDGDGVGEPFDTTDVDLAREADIYHDHRDYKPLRIRVGEGEVVPGVETALRDLEADPDELPVETTMRLEPDEAFGEHDESRIVEIPVDEIDDSAAEGALEPETPVHTDGGDTGWITDVDGDTAAVDFNHELAGVPVEIELEVLEVRDEPTESE